VTISKVTRHPVFNVLGNPNFRLFWIGQATSLLGDHFFFVALPWLVLRLTNDPLVLGAVMALEGVPRAAFMIFGGAITDRFSPRSVMLVSDILRLFMTAALAVLIFNGNIQLWMIYLFALAFGLVSSFFQPASGAIMPMMVASGDLQTGNAIFYSTAQISGVIGPAIVGGLIALFTPSGAIGSGRLDAEIPDILESRISQELGLVIAFIFDAATFLVSVVTLWMIKVARPVSSGPHENPKSIWESIVQGFRFVFGDPMMRVVSIALLVMTCLFSGPAMVGIPVIAHERHAAGAVAYGLLLSSYAGGSLIGLALAGANLRLPKRWMFIFFCLLLGSMGAGLIILGISSMLGINALIAFVVGFLIGYFTILMLTWVQQRTPATMQGRVMSLAMLANIGLAPVSQAISGALIKVSLTGLMVGAGILILIVGTWLVSMPFSRKLVNELARN
jgi:MFS family permease